MNETMTDEQLWDLCTEYVKEEKPQSTYRDKAINWDYEQLNWQLNQGLK